MRLSAALCLAMLTPLVSSMKTVLVLGGSYGGASAARFLARDIPDGYRIVVLERNSHANHLYALPRFSVIPDHEFKAFVPYTGLFTHPDVPSPSPSPHQVIHGSATRLERNRVTYTPAAYATTDTSANQTIEFDYLVYALGARLPAPIDFWGAENVFDEKHEASVNLDLQKIQLSSEETGSKANGIEWLKKAQGRLRNVRSVLVVGGGALGIQFATDLKDVYPDKSVTLLHSRAQLLPRFPMKMHDEINATMHNLGINTILGQRLDIKTTLPENAEYNERGERIVKTENGRAIAADLVLLCTGQSPNTAIMSDFASEAVDSSSGLVKVLRSLQVSLPGSANNLVAQTGSSNGDNEDTTVPHIFAIGDSADAFGAIKAGHTAYHQAEVAAKNILALINQTKPELHSYTPGDPAIKVSLGRRHYAIVMGPDAKLTVGDDGKDDLDAPLIWSFYGANFEKDSDK